MEAYLNLAKANFTPKVRNPIPDRILLYSSIILPPPTLLIPSADISLLAARPLLVCSIEISDAAIRLTP